MIDPRRSGGLRDDVRIISVIVQPLDGTMTGALNEIRAEHARSDRLAKGVRRLEDESRPPND